LAGAGGYGMLCSRTEVLLISDLEELENGSLCTVFVPYEERTEEIPLTGAIAKLVLTLRQYPEVSEIRVQDGVPLWLAVTYRPRVGKLAEKKIKLT
jgi:hypothetical protein